MANTTIITGQYVRISQTPAGLGERFLACFIDLLIIVVYMVVTIYSIAAIPSEVKGGMTLVLLLLVLYLPVLGYSLLFEVFNKGQSPGKKLLNIKVVMVDGSTPTLGAYLLRWLLFPIDVTLTGGLGVLFVLLSKNSQRIGDLAAGTMVVRMNNYKKVKVSLDEYKHLTEGYVPVYPQVTDLSLEQIGVIEKVLGMGDKKRETYILELGKKLKTILQVDVRTSDEVFLQTLIRDYQFFAYVDV